MKEKEVLEFAEHKINETKRSLQRVERQRELLDQKEEELKQALNRWENLAHELSKETTIATGDIVPDLNAVRLSDACYYVMRSKGRGLQAKELVVELRERGRVINAKNPVDSVHKMLLRDRRFYRPGDHGTYWELDEWKVLPLDETQGQL
ncbi:hypothetical protein ES705_06967 [subsurface metagenome]